MTIHYEYEPDEGYFTDKNSFETISDNSDQSSENEATNEQPAEKEQVIASIKEESNRKRKYPDVFYCPITKNLLKDAVIIPNGETFERSAIEERGDVAPNKMYFNRALKAVMEDTISSDTSTLNSLRSSLLQMGRSLRQNIDQYLDDSSLSSSSTIPIPGSSLLEQRPLSESYYCPITFNLIHDPVIDADGHTFERAAVVHWIVSKGGTSPITRKSVTVEDLYPNNALKELMEIETERSEEYMHRSIKRWKEESPPEFIVASKAVTTRTANDVEAQSYDEDTTASEYEAEERSRFKKMVCAFTYFTMLMILIALFIKRYLDLRFVI